MAKPASRPNMQSTIAERRRLLSFGKISSSSRSQRCQQRKKVLHILKFVCLASKDAVGPPSSIKDQTDLFKAGLGDRSVSIFEGQE